MAFFFNDLDEYIKDVRDYAQELNTPIIDENGEEKIQLIDFAGNPTEDNSIFGNRQSIFKHFEELYEAYMENTEEPSLENFNTTNAANVIISTNLLRKLLGWLDETWEAMQTKLKELEGLKHQVSSGTLPVSKIPMLETDAIRIVDDMYKLAFQMKKCFEVGYENNNIFRLMGLVMGYVSSGRDFFKSKIWSDDPFTPQLDKRHELFNKIRQILKFDARCDSVKEMITTIN